MRKNDGTYNDRYEPNTNNIPYCFEDFQEVYLAVTEEEGQINVGRSISQAICELANLFLTELASRPISLPEKQDVPPSYILENVRSKFPELYPYAKDLYSQYLSKWQNDLKQLEDHQKKQMNLQKQQISSKSSHQSEMTIQKSKFSIQTRKKKK